MRREENTRTQADKIILGKVLAFGFIDGQYLRVDRFAHRLRYGLRIVVMDRDMDDGGFHGLYSVCHAIFRLPWSTCRRQPECNRTAAGALMPQ
jgi:hypothetical protein